MAKRHVLSEANLQLLVELCAEFGSDEEARKDPNFVLGALLEELNEEKAKKGWSMIPMFLRDNISLSHLKYIREKRAHPEKFPE